MIKLCVESYCHDCGDFEPHVVRIFNGLGVYETKIKCEHRDRCIKIAEHIRDDMEAEKNDVHRETED